MDAVGLKGGGGFAGLLGWAKEGEAFGVVGGEWSEVEGVVKPFGGMRREVPELGDLGILWRGWRAEDELVCFFLREMFFCEYEMK